MIEDLQREITMMVAKGYEPGGIVMTPLQMTRFMAEVERDTHLRRSPNDDGSGWEFAGLPIYRSFEISGPTVVSHEVLDALRKMGRGRVVALPGMHMTVCASAAVDADLDPVLF